MIAKTAVVHPDVTLGRDVVIEDYCVIGMPPLGQPGNKTVIGDGDLIRSHTVIYAGNQIGKRFQTGNRANIRENNQIGDDVSIGTGSNIEHDVLIEDGVRIHSQAFVPEFSVLRKNSWVGPGAVLTNARYPASPEAKKSLKGPTLGEHSRIGANATILPGVNVGDNSLVGAGSVVTKDVPANTVVAGNPARKVKSIDELPYGE